MDGYYRVIPNRVYLDKNLTSNDKIIFILINGLANSRGYCSASNTYIAENSNVSLTTVKKGLANLEKEGYIQRSNVTKENKTLRKITITKKGKVGKRPTPLKEEDKSDLKNMDKELTATVKTLIPEIKKQWNNISELPPIRHINKTRFEKLKHNIKTYGIESIGEVIRNIRKSEFLLGYKTDFKVTFDWVIDDKNYIKILEGNFNNETGREQNKEFKKLDELF